MFMDDYTAAQIAPSGAFGQTFFISCTDPLLTPSEATALCGHIQPPGTPAGDAQIAIARRNVEGGPRIDERRHTDYRAVLGARGDFLDNWHYDFYWQYGASVFADEYVNDVSLAKAQFALNDCIGAPATGIDSGCVPWNVFQGGGVTHAATQYIDTPGFQSGGTTENILNLTVNGNLGPYGIKSPWANDGVGIAFGAEYRREALTFNVDEEFSSGDLAGQGGPKKATAGAYSVDDVFGELRVPIVEGAPLAKSLVLNASDRWSDYSIEGSANTYAVGANWAIDDNIMLRGGYNRAVRAPNVLELFAPQEVGLDFTNDPCAGTPTATAAQCARTGVSATQYGAIAANPAAQYNGHVGGNPQLKPELADTWSGGFVLTPREYVRGFDLSVDYFHINVQNAVAGVGAQTIMNECITAGTVCSLINRAPGSGSLCLGSIGFVVDTKQNVATLRNKRR